jgi:hypothetical protein
VYNAESSGDEGMRRDDDLVSPADSHRSEREGQCRGAGADPDAVTNATVGREFVFEASNLLAKNEPTARKYALETALEFFDKRGMLAIECRKRNFHAPILERTRADVHKFPKFGLALVRQSA